MCGKKLILVAVGASPNANPQVDAAMSALLTEEQKQYIKVFYCQGGINYDKMKLPSKLMMKMYSNVKKMFEGISEKDIKTTIKTIIKMDENLK